VLGDRGRGTTVSDDEGLTLGGRHRHIVARWASPETHTPAHRGVPSV
jgi:hypothetical protein